MAVGRPLLRLAVLAWVGACLAGSMTVDLATLPAYDAPDHTHESVLDPDGVFTVLWTPDLDKQEVVWEIHARTRGWLGFGFSSNGGMGGADIVTAWVEDGKLHLQDRHGVGPKMPPEDEINDWRPLYARENDTHTMLVVARDVNTCDPEDYVLTNETVRLLYAWGEEDPSGDQPPYHGPRRGNRYGLVLAPFHRDGLLEDFETITVRQRIVLPHTQDTFYWCHIEKIPEWKEKHHYIGFDMIYGENAHSNLHHSVAFECHTQDGTDPAKLLESHVGHPGYECYTPNMPPEFYLCERFLINWAIGSEGELLPEKVGIPLRHEHGGATYLMFQSHYDNKRLERDVTVEWSMRLYHTTQLRPWDASIIGLGHSLIFSLTVPPRTSDWLVVGHCSSACTAAALPPEGVNIFTVFLHGHYLVRAIRLRHFRGLKELPPIAVDTNYAADFQQSRRLSREVKLLPGDHLTVECDYNSETRDTATFTGWRADDEMCQAFINYYPRVPLAMCRSSPHPRLLTRLYHLKGFQSDLDLSTFEFNPEVGDGRRYQEAVNALPWSTLDKQKINSEIIHGDQFIKCQYNYGISLKLDTNVTGYPTAVPFVPAEDKFCALRASASASVLSPPPTFTLLPWLLALVVVAVVAV
uniref:DOMON domain-containing protein n=1 Tax=Scylla olivacea TaxID=85551 RepID=A0A0P4WA35_SCYOL